MSKVFEIKGFKEYEIVDKVLYRKKYKTRSKSTKWQYRERRRIEITKNNGVDGYMLVQNGKRKWHSLTKLRNLLITKN